jgi:hypothetical protein
MADSNDPWKRFRDRQLTGKKEMSLTRQRAAASGAIDTGAETLTTAELERMIADCEQQMDQLNAVYNQFLSNADKRPPVEQRKRLGKLIEQLVQSPKAHSQIRFKCTNTVTRFQTLCDRWDKMLRAIENGTLKRRKQEMG